MIEILKGLAPVISSYCGIHMMSLLILNQKVLYLVLLITVLSSANQNITIYVQQNGTDQSECMKGNKSIPCNTLSYVLNQIDNGNNDIFDGTSLSVYVYITYYQEITNLSHIQLLVNLYLIGVDNPILDFSGSGYDFSLQGGGAFYAENITFYTILGCYSLVTVSFNKCIFTSGGRAVTNIEGLYIRNVHNLTINNCLFRNNDAQLQLIVIESVLNVEIFGCEFYQNKGQKDLIKMYSFVHLFLEMDNCRIYDNEVVVSTISMEGFNSQSMITVSNCLFSNNTSAGHVLLIAIDRLYMSNVNLISNKIKRIGTSIIQITQIHTNGKQHLNISNINFINNMEQDSS